MIRPGAAREDYSKPPYSRGVVAWISCCWVMPLGRSLTLREEYGFGLEAHNELDGANTKCEKVLSGSEFKQLWRCVAGH